MKIREIAYIIIIATLCMALIFMRRPACTVRTEVRCDTVVVRDTIRDTVPVVRTVRLQRVDTVWLRAARDTVTVEVEVPIERKSYQTEDYRAVIEGFRPRLAEIELYRNTVYIERTETVTLKRPARWGIGIQAGWGVTPSGPAPYLGVGLQYSIITW